MVLANSKRQGSVRNVHEDEKMMRLFIMIPTSFTQKDVEDEFSVSLFIYCNCMSAFVTITSNVLIATQSAECGLCRPLS